MSSKGILQRKYINGVLPRFPAIEQITISNPKNIWKNKFIFISELTSMLFQHKHLNESLKNISDLIVLSLGAKENAFDMNISKFEYEYDINRYLEFLNKVRYLLMNNPDLTNNQKFDYCRIERFFMKLYLKEYLSKISF